MADGGSKHNVINVFLQPENRQNSHFGWEEEEEEVEERSPHLQTVRHAEFDFTRRRGRPRACALAAADRDPDSHFHERVEERRGNLPPSFRPDAAQFHLL